MQRRSSINLEAFIKSLILLGFSTFLFWLVESNKIVFYINPRFVWLTETAAVLIFIMFLVQAGNSYRGTSANHSHCHSGQSKIKLALLPFVVTLLMAFLLPNNALDASLAYNKRMNLNARPVTSGQSGPSSTVPSNVPVTQTSNNSTDPKASLSKDSYQSMVDEIRKSSIIKVTEENYTLVTSEINMYPDKYVGKEIAMLGFVFRNQDFPSNQFGLVRYVVSCCSADAIIDGFLCEYNNASDLSKGSWLNIRGTIQKGEYENSIIPMIKITSFSKGQEPKSPYIYPFNY